VNYHYISPDEKGVVMKACAWFLQLAMLGIASVAHGADKPLVIDLWPDKAPGDKVSVGEEKVTEPKPGAKNGIISITNVTRPTLTVFRPAKEKATGAAVVIAPGGGYNILAWDLEGTEVAEWLSSVGVTAFVLKYRVPRRSDNDPKDGPPPQALMDAQRALSIVRSRAGDFGIDPKRIGMLGFSAGGHLTAWTETNFDKREYEPIDEIDKVSCRPDFAVVIYPGYLARDKDELAPEIRVSKETPPTFIAQATDDPVRAENSIVLWRALKKAGVSAELHLYAKGGHGFGLRPSEKPCSTWPKRCEDWLQSQGYLKAAKP
jgi:acetyl esterase/lipase